MLGLVVTDTLYRIHPDVPEGTLAKLRAAVVNSRALAEVGRGLELGTFIRLGKGEEGTGGRDKSSILADTVEAVIGAIYLDQGLESATEFVHRLFDPLIAESSQLGAGLDWKTSLQELTAAVGIGVPEYVVEESGPDHEKTFNAAARVAARSSAAAPDARRRKPSRRPPRAPGGRSRPSTATTPPLRPLRHRIQEAQPCPNFPKSRWSGAVWPAG